MPKDEMLYRGSIMDILADYRDDYKFDIGEAYDEIKMHSRRYFSQNTTRRGSGSRKRGGKRRRKLSKWQQFVKKNSKFPRFKYKSGRKKGMINLKALGVAYRKKKR